MGLLDKLFGKKSEEPKRSEEPKKSESIPQVEVSKDGNSIQVGDIAKITISAGYVGSSTGSLHKDYYVYEWYIEETGEIFYVGKGRGDRYKEYHEHAYEAEKIRKKYNVGIRFVAKNLSEEEALELESQEMIRILNETNDRLTNRIIPFFTKRDNGYSRSESTPPYEFETAPTLYAAEIDEHYFDIKWRAFDEVAYENLSRPVFIDKGISSEEIEIIYGGNYEKYYKEVVALLEQNGSHIMKSRYAKSVSAWIYPCDDYVTNYDNDEKLAEERIGRRVPAYHLIDVWKFLKDKFGDSVIQEETSLEIKPTHSRVPLSQIKNRNDWSAGFDAGFKYWEEGDAERKAGNIEVAIQLFDKARYNGYFAPVLYNSYAMAYRKLKDLDNEIAILDEGIERYRADKEDNSQIILMYEEQRKKAISKLMKKK